jgi:uridylate kinase
MSQARYQRILLKLSGEALAGSQEFGLDCGVIAFVAAEIQAIAALSVQLGIVVGGGNFFRGKQLAALGVERVAADQIGMLATVINALALRDALEQVGLSVRIYSAIAIQGILPAYNYRHALTDLEHGHIVIFAAGIASPFVTTDFAASLRAIELRANILCKATNVDGIFDTDPRRAQVQHCYQQLSYATVLEKKLQVMDLAAILHCEEHKMPIAVFNLQKPRALLRVVFGESEGTIVQ